MDELLARVLAFDRGVRVRGAQRATEIPEGIVVRHHGLPNLYHLNAVLLDRGITDAPALTRLADEHLGDLAHRHVVLNDTDLAERLAPDLLDAGWTRHRVVFMRLVHAAERRTGSPVARPIDARRARALQLTLLSEEAPRTAPDGTVASALGGLLVAGQEAVRAGTRSIMFAAAEPAHGEPASMCTLFLHDGAAMIDEVGTLTTHRGHGLARAVVTAALDAALAEHADPIVVPADLDDWPQLIYASLGFEPLGQQVAFLRT